MPQFTDSDVGKAVVNPVGEEVGVVTTVTDGVAYVDPDPGWTDRIAAEIGRDDDDPSVDEYPLEDHHVEEVTDDRVRLRQDLSTDRAGTD